MEESDDIKAIAESPDMEAATRTYESFLTLVRRSVPVIAVIVLIVIILIS